MTARLTQLAERDVLTDAYNRRAFYTIVDNLFARGKRDKVPMAVCYIDLDNFKAINDDFGHQAGDEVLKLFADMAKQTLRKHDLLARFGGEEFVVVLPDTSLTNARAIAERLRESLIALELPDMPKGYVTCSIGVAAVESLTEDICINDLLEQSDHALYHAKRSGKNMVCSY
jgi:diguanylate cyclase (GGDEF)-like protein